jgi:hypothetical protein
VSIHVVGWHEDATATAPSFSRGREKPTLRKGESQLKMSFE